MADIDLIPNEYRYWTWQLVCLQRCAIGFAVFVVVVMACYFTLTEHSKQYQQRLMELQAQQAVSQNQQQSLEALTSQNAELQRQWNLLNGLRGGLSVTDILRDIDKALAEEQVWFVDWQFSRAGEMVGASTVDNDTGYFIVVQKNNSVDAGLEKWQIKSHIKIKGEAIDHVAFSDFVQRLLRRPSVADVRVVKTRIQGVQNLTQTIGFEVAVLINNRGGDAGA